MCSKHPNRHHITKYTLYFLHAIVLRVESWIFTEDCGEGSNTASLLLVKSSMKVSCSSRILSLSIVTGAHRSSLKLNGVKISGGDENRKSCPAVQMNVVKYMQGYTIAARTNKQTSEKRISSFAYQ